jgi:hypothetical protein
VTVTVACPRCGEDVEVKLTPEDGGWVCYGSAAVRLPSGPEVDIGGHACEGLTEEDIREIETSAAWMADDYDPREDREDVP